MAEWIMHRSSIPTHVGSNPTRRANLIFESEQLATVVRTSMDLLPLFTLPKLKTLATSVAFAERITAHEDHIKY